MCTFVAPFRPLLVSPGAEKRPQRVREVATWYLLPRSPSRCIRVPGLFDVSFAVNIMGHVSYLVRGAEDYGWVGHVVSRWWYKPPASAHVAKLCPSPPQNVHFRGAFLTPSCLSGAGGGGGEKITVRSWSSDMIFATSISFSVYKRTELVWCQFCGPHNGTWILLGEGGRRLWVGWPCCFEVPAPPTPSVYCAWNGRENKLRSQSWLYVAASLINIYFNVIPWVRKQPHLGQAPSSADAAEYIFVEAEYS